MDYDWIQDKAWKYGKSYVKGKVLKYAKKRGEDALQYASNEAKEMYIDAQLLAKGKYNPNRRNPKRIAPTDAPTSVPTSAPTDAPRLAPQINLPGDTTTMSGEVPVMPRPKKIAKIHPDYFTVNLPYIARGYTTSEASFSYNAAVPFAIIRLNSIYDPLKQINATTGNPTNEADTQPQGRNIWDTHFKFYRVLSADVKLTFVTNRHADLNSPSRVFNESYAVGYELVDENHAISNHVDMFMMTKRARHQIMTSSPKWATFSSAGAVVNTYAESIKTSSMTYQYDPNSWTYHVEELGTEETWTPILENPAVDHDLHVRIMHLDTTLPTDQAGGFGVFIQVMYTVQFRESVDAHFKTLNTSTAGYPTGVDD